MLNNLTIMGRVTKPLELKHLTDGMAVLDFDIANSTKIKDKEITTFLRCVAFGRGAEVMSQFVKKGERILLQGELRQKSYTDKSGANKTYLYMQVNAFDLIEKKGAQEDKKEAPAPIQINTQDTKGKSLKNIMDMEFNEIPF